MKKKLLFAVLSFSYSICFAQRNLEVTNPLAEQVMTGKYNPANYGSFVSNSDSVAMTIVKKINPDSLHANLVELGTFYNRNTGSDTSSATRGIGAARRWVYSKFKQFGDANEHRLIPSYLQFDSTICNTVRHREPFAVLPGIDSSDHSIVIIEAHLDSRCESVCDTACLAQGIDDNGSGSALVIELARVLSHLSFNHTIIFITNIGEEQGLDGSVAFASYLKAKGIKAKAVLNNDIVGGILCGHSSSAPGCPAFRDADSTRIRVFSYGGFNSLSKNFARYTQLEYQEKILPISKVPMTISVMTPEDRTGRGGDHIPFRELGFPAIRFTSSYENGNANSKDTSYRDDQHSSRDILGYDTNHDGIIDSFLIDFDYLKRNAQINAIGATMAALSPKTPDLNLSVHNSNIQITINSRNQLPKYKIGVRTNTFDFDTVYSINKNQFSFAGKTGETYFISIASVNKNNVESFFSEEKIAHITSKEDSASGKNIFLLSEKPDPNDDASMLSVLVNQPVKYDSASIRVSNSDGKTIQTLHIKLNSGLNEVLLRHTYQWKGIFLYQLIIDGKMVEEEKVKF
jgi:hypothetical protein